MCICALIVHMFCREQIKSQCTQMEGRRYEGASQISFSSTQQSALCETKAEHYCLGKFRKKTKRRHPCVCLKMEKQSNGRRKAKKTKGRQKASFYFKTSCGTHSACLNAFVLVQLVQIPFGNWFHTATQIYSCSIVLAI